MRAWLARGDLGVQPQRVRWVVGARAWLGWLIEDRVLEVWILEKKMVKCGRGLEVESRPPVLGPVLEMWVVYMYIYVL